jgi:hypothetical protein
VSRTNSFNLRRHRAASLHRNPKRRHRLLEPLPPEIYRAFSQPRHAILRFPAATRTTLFASLAGYVRSLHITESAACTSLPEALWSHTEKDFKSTLYLADDTCSLRAAPARSNSLPEPVLHPPCHYRHPLAHVDCSSRGCQYRNVCTSSQGPSQGRRTASISLSFSLSPHLERIYVRLAYLMTRATEAVQNGGCNLRWA